MRKHFYTPAILTERRIRVLVLGAGGTGGEVLDALARIHLSLIELGHAGGLEVTVMDGDRVSASNIGRQRFGACDIGHPKSVVLAHRYNLFYGLDWQAVPAYWEPELHANALGEFDVLVSCVDRAAVRVALAHSGQHAHAEALWADFGNGAFTGQFVLGHLNPDAAANVPLRLPNVFDLFPELSTVDDTEEPSCSLAQALRQQDLPVNRMLADAGVSILWRLLRHGSIDTHGAFVDVRACTINPLHIDTQAWAFFGYRCADTNTTPAQHPALISLKRAA